MCPNKFATTPVVVLDMDEAGPPLSKFGARPPPNPLIRGCSAAGGPCGREAAHADADGGGAVGGR